MVFKEILLNQLIWSSKELSGLEEGSEAEKEDWGYFCRLGPPGSRLGGGAWCLDHVLGRWLQINTHGKRDGKDQAEAEVKLSAGDSMAPLAKVGELWR